MLLQKYSFTSGLKKPRYFLWRSILVLASALLFACSEPAVEYKPEARPISSAQQKIYVIGVHPYLNSRKTFVAYQPILNYLEKNIDGVKFRLETSKDYAHFNEKLFSRKFDIALPNPYQTYESLQYDYKVVAKMKPDTVFKGIFVTRKDSAIKTLDDFNNISLSFPAPTALAASMMPLKYLHDNGVDINDSISKVYVGSQYSSIMNAYLGDTHVAVTWPPPWQSWQAENPDKASEMHVILEPEALLNNGLVVRKSVPLATQQKLVALLVGLDATQEGKKILDNAGFAGFEASENETYTVAIERFLAQYKAIEVRP